MTDTTPEQELAEAVYMADMLLDKLDSTDPYSHQLRDYCWVVLAGLKRLQADEDHEQAGTIAILKNKIAQLEAENDNRKISLQAENAELHMRLDWGYIPEDELPDDIPEDEYSAWFDLSWLSSGVRLGPCTPSLRARMIVQVGNDNE